MKFKKILLFLLFFAFEVLAINYQDSITQDSITFYFNQIYPVGQFANGDWWVAGDTVIIDSITPHVYRDINGIQNGWEVNPLVEGGQGFSQELTDFDSTLIPNFPYKSTPISSIVKSVRSSTLYGGYICRKCLQRAVVLTVVADSITDTTLLRPPYVGTVKPFYSTNDFRIDLLPSLSPPANTPTIASFAEIHNLQMDHRKGASGIETHAIESFIDDYGAYVGQRNGNITLRLMLNDPIETKMPLLISYVQYGMDMCYAIPLGWEYTDGGGHMPGNKIPRVFAAVMLGDQNLINMVRDSAHIFHERKLLSYNRDSTMLMWGDPQDYTFAKLDSNYWKVVNSHIATGVRSGYKSFKDPYGYIDGGGLPGADYQYLSSLPWKSSILSLFLMPELKEAWSDTLTTNYVERWVQQGIWTQPDPCAPADGNWANYGITFGTDGNGGCIQDNNPDDGIGRYPELHGTKADSGNYGSTFAKNLWNLYYVYDTSEISRPQYSININVIGSGIVNILPENLTQDSGSLIKFNAIPNRGWYFVEYSGDLNSVNRIDSLILNDNMTVTATFNRTKVFTSNMYTIFDTTVNPICSIGIWKSKIWLDTSSFNIGPWSPIDSFQGEHGFIDTLQTYIKNKYYRVRFKTIK